LDTEISRIREILVFGIEISTEQELRQVRVDSIQFKGTVLTISTVKVISIILLI